MPQTTRPAQHPTGQSVRLAPRLALRALQAGTTLPVIIGAARPEHAGAVLRALPFSSMAHTPLGYEVRLERDGNCTDRIWVKDLPGQLLPWYPNSVGGAGAWVTGPDVGALTAAARTLTRDAGARA